MERDSSMADQPLVSVIVPVYNVAGYIGQCLQSLTEQTLTSLEIICVDDASTDASAEVVRQWQRNDPRIILLQQPHSGVSAARNLGLSAARGTYILFVDGDDWVQRNMLQSLTQKAEKADADLVICSAKVHLQDQNPTMRRQSAVLEKKLTAQDELWDSEQVGGTLWQLAGKHCVWPFLWNKLIRADALQRSGARFSAQLALGEDGAFVMSLLHGVRRTLFVSDRLYNYRYLRRQSATVRLCAEQTKRFRQHIDVLWIMAQDLERSGRLCDNAVELIRWMLWFLYGDFLALPGKERVQMSQKLHDLAEAFGLNGYGSLLTKVEARRLEKLLNTTTACSELARRKEILFNKVENRLIRIRKGLL